MFQVLTVMSTLLPCGVCVAVTWNSADSSAVPDVSIIGAMIPVDGGFYQTTRRNTAGKSCSSRNTVFGDQENVHDQRGKPRQIIQKND